MDIAYAARETRPSVNEASEERAAAAEGLLGSTTSIYAAGITYTTHGGLSSLALGNGVTEAHSWNDRLQQVGISAGPRAARAAY